MESRGQDGEHIGFVETSAMQNYRIEKSFLYLAKKAMTQRKLEGINERWNRSWLAGKCQQYSGFWRVRPQESEEAIEVNNFEGKKLVVLVLN